MALAALRAGAQDCLSSSPTAGRTISQVIRYAIARKQSEEAWREQLDANQYQVCRLKGTERPFTGAYYANTTPGRYHCIACDAERQIWCAPYRHIGHGRLR